MGLHFFLLLSTSLDVCFINIKIWIIHVFVSSLALRSICQLDHLWVNQGFCSGLLYCLGPARVGIREKKWRKGFELLEAPCFPTVSPTLCFCLTDSVWSLWFCCVFGSAFSGVEQRPWTSAFMSPPLGTRSAFLFPLVFPSESVILTSSRLAPV